MLFNDVAKKKNKELILPSSMTLVHQLRSHYFINCASIKITLFAYV